jgi:hypothetical protein
MKSESQEVAEYLSCLVLAGRGSEGIFFSGEIEVGLKRGTETRGKMYRVTVAVRIWIRVCVFSDQLDVAVLLKQGK